ncbi:hypothetical protein B0H14DRAFT_2651637 [Mycena olivaceomarginata]|nr:hypothetical protein B0H14DRAFT_2651637 [Mycena olivaceomarginata]
MPTICRSTNNTRIERLWVEVGSQFARRWRAFFYRLEALHGLDRSNPRHLWLLHFLFLDLINADCDTFRAEWNCHPISGEGHDQSPEVTFKNVVHGSPAAETHTKPQDMCFMGQVRNGMYVDDCEGVHPNVIERYYGTHGPERHRGSGETGAGHLDDEEISAPPSASGSDSDERISIHEAVPVPKHANPFDDEESMQLFYDALEAAIQGDIIPPGYGLLLEEWDEDGYPSFEILRSGRRGSKQLRIALPDSIWRPQAEMWARALAVMDQITYHNEAQ